MKKRICIWIDNIEENEKNSGRGDTNGEILKETGTYLWDMTGPLSPAPNAEENATVLLL